MKSIREEEYKALVEQAKDAHEKYNIFETIIEDYNTNEGPLKGVPYVLKDNISTSNILTTASSNILKDYIPVYDASIYERLKKSGAVLLGKSTMDELAMGGLGITGHLGPVKNPLDPKRIMGGSSSGSAAAVALGLVPFAIGSDTGDSIRKPAAYGGIVGFKPSYGRIPRYGLFAFASSLDHLGFFTKNVSDAAYLTTLLKGPDGFDMTALEDDKLDYCQSLNDDIKNKNLFYFKDLVDPKNYQDEEAKLILESFNKKIAEFKEAGLKIEGIDFDRALLEAIKPSYMIISSAEATSNNANLTGIIFGTRAKGDDIDEIITNSRTEGFSTAIKKRFVQGSYFLLKDNQEKIFKKAQKARRMIVDAINSEFLKYDALIMPSTATIAPLFSELDEQKDELVILENYLAIANFGGYPSISIPSDKINSMPIGISLTGRFKEDALVLNIANKLEELLGDKDV